MANEELRQRLMDLVQSATIEDALVNSEENTFKSCVRGIVGYAEAVNLVEHLIANGATIRERGRWIPIFNDSYCSVCGYDNNADTVTRCRDDSPFCPNCGADMRGGKNEQKKQ